MKRIFIVIFFVGFISGVTDAQEYIYNRGLASLNIGVSVPGYNFGDNAGITLSSHAKLGTTITGEITYFYSWHMGLNFMFTYCVNPIDNNKLAEAYMSESQAFTSAAAESESFRDFGGFGGFVFDVPTNDYFSMVFKMMAGLRNVYKPTSLVKTTTVLSSIDYYETHDNSLVLAFLFSAGGRIKINDRFNLHSDVYYVGSKFDFEYYRNKKLINSKEHLGTLRVTMGVSYAF